MPNIVIYAADYCSYCRRARALLDSKGADYTVLDVERDPRLWGEIKRRTGRETVPQIFVNDHHVGDCSELFALEQRGELEPLLKD